jgi:hypothetical protein
MTWPEAVRTHFPAGRISMCLKYTVGLDDSCLTGSKTGWIMALHNHFHSTRSERHEVCHAES